MARYGNNYLSRGQVRLMLRELCSTEHLDLLNAGLQMVNESRPWMVGEVVTKLLLSGECGTIRELCDWSGYSRDEVYAVVRDLHKTRKVHISEYKLERNRRAQSAIYKWGEGVDAHYPYKGKPETYLGRTRPKNEKKAGNPVKKRQAECRPKPNPVAPKRDIASSWF